MTLNILLLERELHVFPEDVKKLKNSFVNFMVKVSMSLQHSVCASLKETYVDLVQSLST